MTSWGRVLNFQTTVSQHGRLFGSEEAEYIVKQLDRECEKVTGDPQLCLSTNRTRQYTVEFFNQTNCFHDILTRFVREDGSEVGSDGSDWSAKWAVLLGACSMQLGVDIKDQDKDLLRSALHRLDMRQEAKKQMEKALEQYTSNGYMWDFDRNELRPVPGHNHNAGSKPETGNALGQRVLAAAKRYREEIEKEVEGEASKRPKLMDAGRHDRAS